MDQGAVHIYTGHGKGKTTAAIGLALRAAGAGLKVSFIQFLKGGHYSEHKIIKSLKGIDLKPFGTADFIVGPPQAHDFKNAQAAMEAACEDVKNYDVVILDELAVALSLGLVSEKEVMDLMTNKRSGTELIITGRDATMGMIAKADLVTEMKAIKHYYSKGRKAKPGIEF